MDAIGIHAPRYPWVARGEAHKVLDHDLTSQFPREAFNILKDIRISIHLKLTSLFPAFFDIIAYAGRLCKAVLPLF